MLNRFLASTFLIILGYANSITIICCALGGMAWADEHRASVNFPRYQRNVHVVISPIRHRNFSHKIILSFIPKHLKQVTWRTHDSYSQNLDVVELSMYRGINFVKKIPLFLKNINTFEGYIFLDPYLTNNTTFRLRLKDGQEPSEVKDFSARSLVSEVHYSY